MYETLKKIVEEYDKNFQYVKDHFGGDGIENCSREELRDYFIALGKYDLCSELLRIINGGIDVVDEDQINCILTHFQENKDMKWISVKEKKPEPCVDCLLFYNSGKIKLDICYYSGKFGLEGLYGKVTHWMPLPEPPKE